MNTLTKEIAFPKKKSAQSSKLNQIALEFTKGYIDAALALATDMFRKKFKKIDINPATLTQMAKDCIAFNEKCVDLYYNLGEHPREVGIRFLFTRNGKLINKLMDNGTFPPDISLPTFYDSTDGVPEKERAAKQMTDVAEKMGTFYMTVVDNKLAH